MKVVVSIEQRFERTPDGNYWTQTMGAYRFWTRYLEVFDEVSVLARVLDVDEVPKDWIQANGDGVSFSPVPYYLGPWQYLLKSRQVRRAVQEVVRPRDAVILRLPSQLAACLDYDLEKTGQPYGVEVVGDPYDVFSPGAVRHPLRPFFRWRFSAMLRKQCSKAVAAAYVTREALQRRYPCSATQGEALVADSLNCGFTTSYSSIELDDSFFVREKQNSRSGNLPFKLIFVGTLAQLYKGPEVLLEAVGRCVMDGFDLQLLMLGDGQYRSWLEERAKELGVGDRVVFMGQVTSGDAVRSYLDKADLFILPSRQEGLPRAMIEAMARGLPCIGTNVGGIPELLAAEDMVPPNNSKALARKICDALKDPRRMERMATRNLETAKEYRKELLRERRVAFYRYIRNITENWIKCVSCT